MLCWRLYFESPVDGIQTVATLLFSVVTAMTSMQNVTLFGGACLWVCLCVCVCVGGGGGCKTNFLLFLYDYPQHTSVCYTAIVQQINEYTPAGILNLQEQFVSCRKLIRVGLPHFFQKTFNCVEIHHPAPIPQLH